MSGTTRLNGDHLYREVCVVQLFAGFGHFTFCIVDDGIVTSCEWVFTTLQRNEVTTSF